MTLDLLIENVALIFEASSELVINGRLLDQIYEHEIGKHPTWGREDLLAEISARTRSMVWAAPGGGIRLEKRPADAEHLAG